MTLRPVKRRNVMLRLLGYVAIPPERKKGTSAKLVATYMGRSARTLGRLCKEGRRTSIRAEILSTFACACLHYAPEIPAKEVEELFSTNGMGPAHMSDALTEMLAARRRGDSHLPESPHTGEAIQSQDLQQVEVAPAPVECERLGWDDQWRFRALANLKLEGSLGEDVLAALWDDTPDRARGAARRFVKRLLLKEVRGGRYFFDGEVYDLATELLEAAGERDDEAEWVNRFRGGLTGMWRWWWPTLRRAPATSTSLGRARPQGGFREALRRVFSGYWNLVVECLKGERHPQELWVMGLWLERRTRRRLSCAWGIFGGIAVVVSVLWRALAVLDQRPELIYALNVSRAWGNLIDLALLALGALVVPLLLWVVGVDIINYHWFYSCVRMITEPCRRRVAAGSAAANSS